MRRLALVVAVALFSPATLFSPASSGSPAAASPDGERAAWRYRRWVTLRPGDLTGGRRATFAALPLPPDLLSRGQPDRRDLRLLGQDGQEVPYLIEQLAAGERTESWEGSLIETHSESGPRTTWVVDLGQARTFDAIQLDIGDTDFARRLRIEAGDAPTGAFRLVRDQANVFDEKWRLRVRRTQVELPAPETARYLRIIAADGHFRPLHLIGVTAERRRMVPEERWVRELSATPLPGRHGASQYRIEQAAGLPIDAIEVITGEPAFARQVRLFEEIEAPGKSPRVLRALLGNGEIYRLRLKETATEDNREAPQAPRSIDREAPQSVELLSLPVQRLGAARGRVVLEIDDGDSPPLRDVRVRVSGVGERMVFPLWPAWSSPASGGAGATGEHAAGFTLYYGNPATRAPAYDLEALRGRLADRVRPGYAVAAVGLEAENPLFRPAPPLHFAASVGAPIKPEHFRMRRALSFSAGEDLYGLILSPEDLALLRSDLGDLRIADGADHQVPYVLETAVAERKVALSVESETGPHPPRISRYHLIVDPPLVGAGAALPLRAVELDIRETFFQRRARLLAPAPNDPGGNHGGGPGAEVLYAGELAREEGGPPVRLVLDGNRRHELILEIEEGDNLALTLAGAAGWVQVPRLAFKVVPDRPEYRLLLGNESAEPPRYDIEGLRQTVLSYAAVPVSPGPLSANPAYRRLLGNYFRSAPPTAILWGALLASVVGLLWLTARLLRKPEQGPGPVG